MIRLYCKYFSIHFRSAMEYRASFFMTCIGQFLISFSMFLGVYFMFSRFKIVDGYSFQEVLLCFSVILAGFSMAEFLFRGFDAFISTVSNGDFDRILLRPQNEIFSVMCSKLSFQRLAKTIQAFIMLWYGVNNCGVLWTFDKIFTLVSMIICATILFGGLFLAFSGICFFTIQGIEIMNVLTYGSKEFGAYPYSIYGNEVLKFLTYCVPLALVQVYPLHYILGRNTNPIMMVLPWLSTLFILPCYLLWRFGVRHYKSSGS